MAIGLALAFSSVSPSLARGSGVLEHCNSTETGTEAEQQTDQGPGSTTGVSVDVPIGSVCVSPEFLGGEPVYVRRTTVGTGMTIVEVSTAPFMPEGPPGVAASIGRPDQPASW
jgi:hypothetical protein